MSWSAFDPRVDSDSSDTQMSSSHWTSDGVTRHLTEVPSPARIGKTPQLPIITLSSKLMSQSGVAPTLSDSVICGCLVDEEPRCLSLPFGRIQQQQQQQQRPKQGDQSFTNCSSSCDNLSLCTPSAHVTSGEQVGRLCKASSDNPVYSSGSPPVPPRDYVPRAQSRPTLETKHHRPEIHPIVQDGRKCSNTHYWLLPDKQKTSSLDAVDKMAEEQHYVNLTGNGLWGKKLGTSKPSLMSKKKLMVGSQQQTRSHHVSDSAAESSRKSAFYSDVVPLLSDVSSLDSMSVNIPIDEPEDVTDPPDEIHPMTSLVEIRQMLETVRSKIEGVTDDESSTALATHHWNVESAVEYLKVENLFRLGLASREKCRRLLEVHGWNLERAASGLLDLVGVDTGHRK